MTNNTIFDDAFSDDDGVDEVMGGKVLQLESERLLEL